MILILEKDDIDRESRGKAIDEVSLRNDFRYNLAGNPEAGLILFIYQNEIKVFRAHNTNWEGMVYDIDRLYEIIHKYLYYHVNFIDVIPCIRNLSKVLDGKERLEKLTYELQAELFERT